MDCWDPLQRWYRRCQTSGNHTSHEELHICCRQSLFSQAQVLSSVAFSRGDERTIMYFIRWSRWAYSSLTISWLCGVEIMDFVRTKFRLTQAHDGRIAFLGFWALQRCERPKIQQVITSATLLDAKMKPLRDPRITKWHSYPRPCIISMLYFPLGQQVEINLATPCVWKSVSKDDPRTRNRILFSGFRA